MPTDSGTLPSPSGRARPSLVALDIYGTVIDPAGIAEDLRRGFGARAGLAAQLWREKQVELTFRRALMRQYANFDLCTADALQYVAQQLGARLDDEERRWLLDAYLRLPAFPDSRTALERLGRMGSRIVALTNGTEHSVRLLLQRAGISDYFEAILSVDTIQTFKPDPAVYQLVRRAAVDAESTWLISGNPFDLAGAKAYGLKAAWVRRDPARPFDMQEFAPDIVAGNLIELCERFENGV
jgi:2-haloacid dehalogenase